MRAHAGCREKQGKIGADDDGNLKFPALILGALVKGPKMPAQVELDSRPIPAQELQPVERGVSNPVLVLGDHDAARHKASRIVRHVKGDREQRSQVDTIGDDDLLAPPFLDFDGGDGFVDRALNSPAESLEIHTHCSQSILSAREEIAANRRIPTPDPLKEKGQIAVEIFHERGQFKVWVNGAQDALDPTLRVKTANDRPKIGIEHTQFIHFMAHFNFFRRWPGSGLVRNSD